MLSMPKSIGVLGARISLFFEAVAKSAAVAAGIISPHVRQVAGVKEAQGEVEDTIGRVVGQQVSQGRTQGGDALRRRRVVVLHVAAGRKELDDQEHEQHPQWRPAQERGLADGGRAFASDHPG